MALEGTIKEFGLADIFQLLGLQKKTGVLFLKGEDSTVNISFEDGMIVKAEDSQQRPKYMLGQILINRRKISDAQLKASLEIQKSTLQQLGHVLVGQRIITKEDLKDAVVFQMTEIIYKVFRWKGGDYKFYQEKVDYDRELIRPVSSEHILMDGIRMLDEWPLVEQRLPSPEIVLTRRPGPSPSLPEMGDDIFGGFSEGDGNTLSKESMQVLDLVDGSRSVHEIIENTSIGEFDTCRAIVDLIARGLAVPSDAKPESLLLDEVTARQEKIRMPGKLEILPYLFAISAFIAIAFQITGIRQVMNPHITEFSTIKTAFALSDVRNLDDNLLLHFMEYGTYPGNISDLQRLDYISENKGIDPWGRQIIFRPQKDGSFVSVCAGPDGSVGTADDIFIAF